MGERLFICNDCGTLTMGHFVDSCRKCKGRQLAVYRKPVNLSNKERQAIQEAERAYNNASITAGLKRRK
jgi:hypothetical protein